MESLGNVFSAASLEESIGDGGPELRDFVSSSPSELPTFAPETSHSGDGAENRLEFQIFVDGLDEEKNGSSSRVGALARVRESILGLVPDNHIWHLGHVKINPSADVHAAISVGHGNRAPDLVGCLNFGEALDDEWLAVAILTEASKQDPRLAITVRDDDGEFLLIETSSCWPRDLEAWLEPESAVNRVWLRGGDLHIIPTPNQADEGGDEGGEGDAAAAAAAAAAADKRRPRKRTLRRRGPLPLSTALCLLRRQDSDLQARGAQGPEVGYGDAVKLCGLAGRHELNGRHGRCAGRDPHSSRLVVVLKGEPGGKGRKDERVRVKEANVEGPLTEAPPVVQAHFHSRVRQARAVSSGNVHRVKCVLPLQLAMLLRRRPQFVSLAVHAFYLRTPTDTAAAAKAARFGLPKKSSRQQLGGGSSTKRSPALPSAPASSSSSSSRELNLLVAPGSPYDFQTSLDGGGGRSAATAFETAVNDNNNNNNNNNNNSSPSSSSSSSPTSLWSLVPVVVTVSMTRCLFAQLEQQQHFLHPPPHLLAAWTAHHQAAQTVAETKTAETSAAKTATDTGTSNAREKTGNDGLGWDEKSVERGLRLTAAFEMLYHASKSASSNSKKPNSSPPPAFKPPAANPPEDALLLRSDEVHTAMDALIAAEEAKSVPCEECAREREESGGGGGTGTSGGCCCCCCFFVGGGRATTTTTEEDDDSWLDVSPDELESMLKEKGPPPIVLPPQNEDDEDGKEKDEVDDGGGKQGVEEKRAANAKKSGTLSATSAQQDNEKEEEEEEEEEEEADSQKGSAALDAIVSGVHRFLGGSGAADTGAEVPQQQKSQAAAALAAAGQKPVAFDVEAVLRALESGGSGCDGGGQAGGDTEETRRRKGDDDLWNDDDSEDSDDDDDEDEGDSDDESGRSDDGSANEEEDEALQEEDEDEGGLDKWPGDEEEKAGGENAFGKSRAAEERKKAGGGIEESRRSRGSKLEEQEECGTDKRGGTGGDGDDDDDDDHDDKFAGAYSEHLSREIRDGSSVLGKTFELAHGDDGGGPTDTATPTVQDKEEGGGGGEGEGMGGGGNAAGGKADQEEDLSPVDLDGNLVKHLLESFASQDGLAGPAANLLREMGVFFPTVKAEANKSKGESDDNDDDNDGRSVPTASAQITASSSSFLSRSASVPPPSFPDTAADSRLRQRALHARTTTGTTTGGTPAPPLSFPGQRRAGDSPPPDFGDVAIPKRTKQRPSARPPRPPPGTGLSRFLNDKLIFELD